MCSGFDLLFFMFIWDEIVVFVVGVCMVKVWGGLVMVGVVEEVIVKIEVVLFENECVCVGDIKIFVFLMIMMRVFREWIDIIEYVIDEREVLDFEYRDEKG